MINSGISARRTVSEIKSKFTIYQDRSNSATVKAINANQRKIVRGEKEIYSIKRKGIAMDKQRTALKKRENTLLIQEANIKSKIDGTSKRSTRRMKDLNASLQKNNALLELNKKELKALDAERYKNNALIKRSTMELEAETLALTEQKVAYNKLTGSILASSAATLGFIGAIGALVGTIYEGLKLNIEYVEDLNIINQLFGENAEAVETWASSMRNSFGLARTSALKYVSTMKAFLVSAGIEDGLSTAMSGIAVQLAADLSSFRNVSFETSFRAILSGLAGISRTLRYNFGVDIGDEALRERYGTVGGTQAEKIVQRFGLLLERTGFAVGDFKRTKNSPANQLKLLRENFKEFSFLFAQTLLPLLNIMLIIMNKIMEIMIHTQKILTFIGAGLAVAGIGKATYNMMHQGLGAGFLNEMTFGMWNKSKAGGALIGGLEMVTLAKIFGSLFGGFSKKSVSGEQKSTSYLPDDFDMGSLMNGEGQATTNSTVINVEGNMNEDTLDETIFKLKEERFRGGR